MLPGVHVDALPSFARGQLCSISVPGNPAPFAVRQHSHTLRTVTYRPAAAAAKPALSSHVASRSRPDLNFLSSRHARNRMMSPRLDLTLVFVPADWARSAERRRGADRAPGAAAGALARLRRLPVGAGAGKSGAKRGIRCRGGPRGRHCGAVYAMDALRRKHCSPGRQQNIRRWVESTSGC